MLFNTPGYNIPKNIPKKQEVTLNSILEPTTTREKFSSIIESAKDLGNKSDEGLKKLKYRITLLLRELKKQQTVYSKIDNVEKANGHFNTRIDIKKYSCEDLVNMVAVCNKISGQIASIIDPTSDEAAAYWATPYPSSLKIGDNGGGISDTYTDLEDQKYS